MIFEASAEIKAGDVCAVSDDGKKIKPCERGDSLFWVATRDIAKGDKIRFRFGTDGSIEVSEILRRWI